MVATSHLKSFQALELAVRTGSLKQAADVLAITPAAVGQRIKTLEDYLGIDLLVRSRSGLRPSPALSDAIPHLGKAFAELNAAAEILDLQKGNEIHIAANSDWVELWFQPRLERFRAAYPNVLFCINGEGDVPMRLGQIDCEIEFGGRHSEEGVDLLFHDYLVPVSSLQNTQRISSVSRSERLEGFPLLHLDFYKDDQEAIDWPEWTERFRYRRTAAERGIRFQRIVPGIEAVVSNAGLMICGLALISEKIEDAEVSLPFPIAKGGWTDHAFHARFRTNALVRPQVRKFRQWLLEESRITREWLAATTRTRPRAGA